MEVVWWCVVSLRCRFGSLPLPPTAVVVQDDGANEARAKGGRALGTEPVTTHKRKKRYGNRGEKIINTLTSVRRVEGRGGVTRNACGAERQQQSVTVQTKSAEQSGKTTT